MRPVDRETLPLLAPARPALIGATTATLVGGLFTVAQAFIVGGLVVSVVEHQELGSWPALVAAVFAGRAVATWVSDALSARAAAQLSVSLRGEVLARSRAPGEDRPRAHAGSEAALATRGVSAVEPYVTRFLPSLVIAMSLPPLVVLAILSQDWVSALIVILTIPLIPVFAALVGWATQTKAQRQWRAMTVLAGHFHDVVRGLPTLIAFRRADAQTESIRAITHRHRRATLDTLRLAFASSAVLELVATLSVAVVAVFVGLRLAAGDLDLGTAMVVLLLAPEAYWPLRRVGAEFHAAAEGGASLREIAALGEPAAATARTPAEGAAPASLRLVDVSVTYPGRQAPALAPCSAEIKPGQLVAVTGPSGIGKSTLLAALRGTVAATGVIESDGLLPDDPGWSDRVAWIAQRPWFVDGGIGDNVRVGAPRATDADVWEALRRVGLADVVAALPGGLAAPVGEDGRRLSAGERARLSLARAVIAPRPLTLLDEPTAHLDADTEQVVLDTVRWLATRSTVVVVAHRPPVIEAADQVLALQPEPQPAPQPVPAPAAAAGAVADGAAPGRAAAPEAGAGTPISRPEDDDDLSPERARRRLWLGIGLGTLSSASGVALTATAGWLIARASEQPPVLMLLVAIIAVRTFGIARPVFRYAERLVSHDAALRALADERVAVYRALIPLTPGALGRRRGDVLASVVDDVDALVDQRLRVWNPVATAVGVSLLAALACAVALPGSAVVVLALGAVGLGCFALGRHLATRAESCYVRDRAELSREVTAYLEGREHLEAWGAAEQARSAIADRGRRLGHAAERSNRGAATARAGVLLAVGVGVWAMAGLAADAASSGAISDPTAALVVLIPLGLAEVLALLPDAGMAAARVRRAVDRLSALRRLEPLVREPRSPVEPSGGTEVALTGLSAGWAGEPAFAGLDLLLAPGERVAIVGPSGSGKSTVAAVLLRFIDPMAGRATLGGRDLRELRLDDVRAAIGLVDDDPHVFGSTLAENIRLARPGADDAAVLAALESAQLGAWTRGLPDGLGTFIGAGGDEVSGGERARIALARSLLADQAVLVLDEPVAHLDAATADAVLGDLMASSAGRSVVLISHDERAVGHADVVLALGHPEPVAP